MRPKSIICIITVSGDASEGKHARDVMHGRDHENTKLFVDLCNPDTFPDKLRG